MPEQDFILFSHSEMLVSSCFSLSLSGFARASIIQSIIKLRERTVATMGITMYDVNT